MSVKKVVFFTLIIVLSFLINNLAHSIYATWQKKHLVTKAKEELAREKREHEELQQKMINVSRPGFIEEEARNKLLLGRPGEEVVVMPTIVSEKPRIAPAPTHMPNWEKWRKLFF